MSIKKIDFICISAISLAFCLAVFLLAGSLLFAIPAEKTKSDDTYISTDYVNRIFDDSYVHEIDIQLPQVNWDYLVEHAKEEQYVICNAVIDGEFIKNIAIRPKGNSSLSAIKTQGSDHFSFKIEFDHFHKNNTYYGLDKLSLNNLGQDVSCLKDFLTYHMMNEIGIAAPLSSFIHMKLNGEDFGLFLAVESIEDSFAKRNYGTNYGNLYKPECFEISTVTPKAFMNMEENPYADVEFYDSLGPGDRVDILGTYIRRPFEIAFGQLMEVGALKYVGDDPKLYNVMFDSAVFENTKADKEAYINAVRLMNSDADASECVDVDSVLKYLIVHNFVNNYDSYSGVFVHNYYLRENEGKLSMIPWDYNLAFGIFTFETAVKSFMGDDSPYQVELKVGNAMSDAKGMVNYPIDTPNITVSLEDRPLMKILLGNEKYLALYHKYFSEFLDDFFGSGKFESLFNRTCKIINPYLQQGQTFYTYEQTQKGAKAVHDYCVLREKSIRGQLDGTIPATMKGQSENWENLVEIGDLNLADSVTFDSLVFGITADDIIEILDAIAGKNEHNSEGVVKTFSDLSENPKEIPQLILRIMKGSRLVKNALSSIILMPIILIFSLVLLIVAVKSVKKYERRKL